MTQPPRFEMEIAPAVRFPDWSVVTSGYVEQALVELLREDRMLARWTGLTAAIRTTHIAILNTFVSSGRAPQAGALSSALGLSEEVIDEHIADLVARDLVVERDGRLEGAYPFTEHDTGHLVEIDSVRVSVMCAIDALGVGAMFKRPTIVRSRCRQCREPIEIETGARGLSIIRQSPVGVVA